jgi:hypothetical protein
MSGVGTASRCCLGLLCTRASCRPPTTLLVALPKVPLAWTVFRLAACLPLSCVCRPFCSTYPAAAVRLHQPEPLRGTAAAPHSDRRGDQGSVQKGALPVGGVLVVQRLHGAASVVVPHRSKLCMSVLHDSDPGLRVSHLLCSACQISALVHPDKCTHPDARLAFEGKCSHAVQLLVSPTSPMNFVGRTNSLFSSCT